MIDDNNDYGSQLSGLIPDDMERSKRLLDAGAEMQSVRSETRMLSPEDTPILKAYLWGQLSNVCKYGIWWFFFSPIVLCLFEGDLFAVGLSRFLFNVALFVVHPLTSRLTQKMTARAIMNASTSLRLGIYLILLPGAWIFLRTDILLKTQNDANTLKYQLAFYIVFMVLIFFDGMVVSLSNAADIDCGGTDLVAEEHRIRINDEIRSKYSFLHVLSFEGSLIILAPAFAFGIAAFHFKYPTIPDSFLLLGSLGLVFLVFSIISLVQYNAFIPKIKPLQYTMDFPEDEGTSLSRVCKSARLTWEFKPIFWRLIFVGLETAFEDIMISIIVAEFALVILEGKRDFDYVNSNFYSNLLSAFGRLGSVLTAFAMKSLWKAPEFVLGAAEQTSKAEKTVYAPMFTFAFLSGISAMLLPLAHFLKTQYGWLEASIILSFSGCFLFFSFSTGPKIAFQTLLNDLAFHADETGHLLAFIGTFVTLCDSMLLLLSAMVFGYCGFEASLLILTGFMAFIGLVEFLFGASLVLPSSYGDTYRGYYQVE